MEKRQVNEDGSKPRVITSHLKWLVNRRCKNQKVTLEVLLLLRQHSLIINKNIRYQSLVQELAAIAFSLWRAVFLSELTGDVEKQMENVEDFLGFLVNDNIILYQQDKKTREWSFHYYIKNARYRLIDLAREADPQVLQMRDVDKPARSAKDDWDIAQEALSRAVKAFKRILEESDTSKT